MFCTKHQEEGLLFNTEFESLCETCLADKQIYKSVKDLCEYKIQLLNQRVENALIEYNTNPTVEALNNLKSMLECTDEGLSKRKEKKDDDDEADKNHLPYEFVEHYGTNISSLMINGGSIMVKTMDGKCFVDGVLQNTPPTHVYKNGVCHVSYTHAKFCTKGSDPFTILIPEFHDLIVMSDSYLLINSKSVMHQLIKDKSLVCMMSLPERPTSAVEVDCKLYWVGLSNNVYCGKKNILVLDDGYAKIKTLGIYKDFLVIAGAYNNTLLFIKDKQIKGTHTVIDSHRESDFLWTCVGQIGDKLALLKRYLIGNTTKLFLENVNIQ
jgi:hypothetical protein